jgi:hypothetical protein
MSASARRKGPAGRVRFFDSGRNAERDRSSGNRRYTVIAGKAKWKFRFRCQQSQIRLCRENIPAQRPILLAKSASPARTRTCRRCATCTTDC